MDVADEWLPRKASVLPYKTRLTDRLVFLFLIIWQQKPSLWTAICFAIRWQIDFCTFLHVIWKALANAICRYSQNTYPDIIFVASVFLVFRNPLLTLTFLDYLS